jgi:hypothetical protein
MRTKRSILLVSLVLLFTVTASAQELKGRLRGAQLEVEASYDTLRSFNGRDVKPEFAKLTPQMQADVWTLHLVEVIADHPELTHEQRSVLFEALGFIASGAFEADRNSPDWNTQVREPLTYIEKRAKALLSPELVQIALYDLNKEAALERLHRPTFRVTTNETCHCNQAGNDCFPSVPCERGFPKCTLAQGCGPMYLDICNGLCQF